MRDSFHSVQDDFVTVIDADQSIEDIQAAIFAVVTDLVGNSPA